MEPIPDGADLDLTEDELDQLAEEAFQLRGMARWVYVKNIEDVPTGDYL